MGGSHRGATSNCTHAWVVQSCSWFYWCLSWAGVFPPPWFHFPSLHLPRIGVPSRSFFPFFLGAPGWSYSLNVPHCLKLDSPNTSRAWNSVRVGFWPVLPHTGVGAAPSSLWLSACRGRAPSRKIPLALGAASPQPFQGPESSYALQPQHLTRTLRCHKGGCHNTQKVCRTHPLHSSWWQCSIHNFALVGALHVRDRPLCTLWLLGLFFGLPYSNTSRLFHIQGQSLFRPVRETSVRPAILVLLCP